VTGTLSQAMTVGVQEEFLLVRRDGSVATVAPEILRSHRGPEKLRGGFWQYQIAVTSNVHTGLSALALDLTRGRRLLSAAAAERDARLVASGTPPFEVPGLAAVTDARRYRQLPNRRGVSTADSTRATHVLVAVPSRDLGAEAIRRIRGWLPVLLALGANSPMWSARDTGWASYRHAVLPARPTAVVPPAVTDAAAYDSAVAERIASGAAPDPAGIGWFARLRPDDPVVEIRVADASTTVADAVLLAGLCRALVVTALTEAGTGSPCIDVPDRLLAALVDAAARSGLSARLMDPVTGRVAAGTETVAALVARVGAALESAGDRSPVQALLAARLRLGSGAARQRALRRGRTRAGLVAALSAAALGDVPTLRVLRADDGAASSA
jgi:glutamate---cysteine ligase / carboxylate-amine ligase